MATPEHHAGILNKPSISADPQLINHKHAQQKYGPIHVSTESDSKHPPPRVALEEVDVGFSESSSSRFFLELCAQTMNDGLVSGGCLKGAMRA